MNFFDLANFFELKKSMPNASIAEVMSISGINPALLADYTHEYQMVRRLEMALRGNPDKDADHYYKVLGVSKNDLTRYFCILEMVSPGLVVVGNLGGTDREKSLCREKKRAAVNSLAASGTFLDDEIAQELGLHVDDVKLLKATVPAITPEMPGFELVKRENRIREFFQLYPYSTITEAAKALRMSNKEIRVIIEDLVGHGEVIKFNNSPRPLEYEEKKLAVVSLKKEDPSLSDKEISEKLGISIGQVRQAISETIRLWQMEKAQSYDFYSHKTMVELEEVKRMSLERHNSSDKSSSRWLEIYLQAHEKQIAMLGLKAPERVDINSTVTVSKEHRDKIVSAFMATEAIEAEFQKIEVTGDPN